VCDRSVLETLPFGFLYMNFVSFYCLGMNFSAVLRAAWLTSTVAYTALTISANVPHRQEPLMVW
jgi:hypothetical protein